MGKGRLEAFSDGVFAIIITIMVLEMKVPHGMDPASLRPLLPVFVSYVLSFFNVAMYWNNHHHMLHAVQHINGRILWANIHLLFWLSLFPFVTGWMGENNFGTWPVALYGLVSLFAGLAYYVLAHSLMLHHGKDSTIAKAIGKDVKGKLSVILYGAGVGLSFVNALLGLAMYFLVAAMWIVPDKRIENRI